MTTPGTEHYEPKPYHSISSLCTFNTCPRKYFYQSGCGLTTEYGESLALIFGSALHRGMGGAQRGDLDQALLDFSEVWGDRDADKDDKRNSRVALVIYSTFLSQHNPGIYTVLDPPTFRMEHDDMDPDEVAFAVDLNMDRPFVGKIDAIGKHRDTGQKVVVEYKSTSRMGAGFTNIFTLFPQIISYAMVYELLTDEPIPMAYVEGLHAAKTLCNNITIPVTIYNHQKEWVINWIQRTAEEIKHCELEKTWPTNPSGCNPYTCHGVQGFSCPYIQLCMVENWVDMKDQYTIKRHNMFGKTEDTTE